MSDSDTPSLGFPEAARHFGVSIIVLRRAIRAGRLPAPPHRGATAILPANWLAEAEAAVAASPKTLSRAHPQKTPAFARYKGTSAWQKHRRQARAYAEFRAAASHTALSGH